MLCDTDASTNIKNDVIFDGYECLFDTSETDSCDYIYHPQIDNFMSYTHFECGVSFTQGQVDKMFNKIETDPVVSSTIIDIGDLNDDLSINILDALTLVNTILSNNSPPPDLYLWLGDINNDILLDVLDIILLINIILDN